MNNNIKLEKEHIILEVKKYAAQKKLMSKLTNIYIENDISLQNKSLEELVCIFKKTVETIHIYSEQLGLLGEYVNTVRKIIMDKSKQD